MRQALAALAGGDLDALADLLRDDAVVLTEAGREAGARHVAFALTSASREAVSWDTPRQHGSHALLPFARADGGRSAIVLESRRDAIVFAAVI